MKAYLFDSFGDPEEVLKLVNVEKPIPKNDEVLVKIKTSAVNDYDWCSITGTPFSYRLLFGLFKPRKRFSRPGMELAGVVEATGELAMKFQAGEAVYGDISEKGFGSFAEYLCISEEALEKMPNKMSFEEAASIPHASMLAVQGLHDVGDIKQGQKVLINGGGGGVGAFGLQLAKRFQAEVTGVDSVRKLQRMKDFGFDHVMAYEKTDFTKLDQKFDLILDCKTNRWPFSYLRVLKENGKYVSIGGKSGKLIQLLIFKPLIALFSSKQVFMVALKPNKDLDHIDELYQSGVIKCTIDGPYGFEKTPWAVKYFGEGKHFGKVIIRVNSEDH